jgi:hypothetical protein
VSLGLCEVVLFRDVVQVLWLPVRCRPRGGELFIPRCVDFRLSDVSTTRPGVLFDLDQFGIRRSMHRADR